MNIPGALPYLHMHKLRESFSIVIKLFGSCPISTPSISEKIDFVFLDILTKPKAYITQALGLVIFFKAYITPQLS